MSETVLRCVHFGRASFQSGQMCCSKASFEGGMLHVVLFLEVNSSFGAWLTSVQSEVLQYIKTTNGSNKFKILSGIFSWGFEMNVKSSGTSEYIVHVFQAVSLFLPCHVLSLAHFHKYGLNQKSVLVLKEVMRLISKIIDL